MRVFVLAVLGILVSKPAYAYLDPGTGSMLLYAIVGIAASVLFWLRGFYYKSLGLLFGGRFGRRRDDAASDLVIYSEGRQYWAIFAPVIRALEARGVRCAYLTSAPDDPGLDHASDYVTTKYLGGKYRAMATMNTLTAKLVVMTTPQLDVLMLRRSKSVQHYAHLLHSIADVLLYKKYAFDYFDSVFCSGPYQKVNLRRLEEKRGLPEKRLFDTGCTYFDDMLPRIKDIEPKPDAKPTVLVAPTWGKNGMLSRYGPGVMRYLIDAGFKVIFRPHPQTFLSEPELFKTAIDDLGPQADIEIDRANDGLQSMARSDILLTDISGIIFDYAFLFEKPILMLDVTVERGGFEAEDVDTDIWEISVRSQLGQIIGDDELSEIGTIAKAALTDDAKSAKRDIRNSYCYNFGGAGDVAAEQILDLLAETR